LYKEFLEFSETIKRALSKLKLREILALKENLGKSLQAELKISFTTDMKTNLYEFDGTGLSTIIRRSPAKAVKFNERRSFSLCEQI